MTDERKARLLAYCRLDEPGDGELALLEGLALAAEGYLANAGVEKPGADDPSRLALYELLVNAWVLDSYDNRGTQTAGNALQENPALRRVMNQLKLTVPISGTTPSVSAAGGDSSPARVEP